MKKAALPRASFTVCTLYPTSAGLQSFLIKRRQKCWIDCTNRIYWRSSRSFL